MLKTRKEFSRRCKEIMASTELTEKGKAAKIEHVAAIFIENIIDSFPEICSINERERDIEEKYSGPNGIRYCPKCSTWSPKEPPVISSLAREWSKIKDRKINELCRKVLAGKAA